MIGSAHPRHCGRGERGAAAVELALVMPLLLLVLFAIIDFGRMLNAQITLTEASREGARSGAYSKPLTDVQARVQVASSGLDTTQLTTALTTACPNTTPGYAQVDVTYRFEFITPLSAIAGMFGVAPDGMYDLSGRGVMTCAG